MRGEGTHRFPWGDVEIPTAAAHRKAVSAPFPASHRTPRRKREQAGGFQVGIAGADVNDESLPALALQPRKSFLNAIHVAESVRGQV